MSGIGRWKRRTVGSTAALFGLLVDLPLHFGREDAVMLGQPGEQLALGFVGRKVADDLALRCIAEEAFEVLFHVLHDVIHRGRMG